jgi:hypothetical protein
MNTNNEFFPTDIVVWNGVIATHSSISVFVEEDDELRLATFGEKMEHQIVSLM